MNEENFDLIESDEQEEGVFDKIKGLFSKLGKRNLIVIGAVLLLGVAVCLNWVLFADNNNGGYDYGGGSDVAGADKDDTKTNEVLAYFASAQVSRDRARDEALAVLQNVVDSSDADSAEKTQALEDIATIAANIEAEANIEAMVMAKGFEQCIAIVNDGMCTIVVMSEGLLPNQLSQINEIVFEQTGIKPVNVKYVEKH